MNGFNANERGELIELLENVDRETSAEIVVVTLESIDGADIGDYAIQLGQKWGVFGLVSMPYIIYSCRPFI